VGDDLVKQDNAILIHSTFKDNTFVPLRAKKRYCLTDNRTTINNKPADAYMWSVYGLGLKAENLTVSLKVGNT
jgi:hypothetical protein